MDKLDDLAERVRACEKCPLREEARQPVPGIGSETPKFFIIGEAPGREEDKAGIPFVGTSGKRLNKLLALAHIDLNDCYVTNVCKCRPPSNRQPKKSERLTCYPWLKEELRLLKPKTIITLGAMPLS